MNQDVKAQWLTALRSGQYHQGRGYLNHAGKYCCLGVLCELAVRAGVIRKMKTDDESTIAYGHEENEGLPPREVAEWSGLSQFSCNPMVTEANGERSCVSTLNDRGRTFAEIADLIEEQL